MGCDQSIPVVTTEPPSAPVSTTTTTNHNTPRTTTTTTTTLPTGNSTTTPVIPSATAPTIAAAVVVVTPVVTPSAVVTVATTNTSTNTTTNDAPTTTFPKKKATPFTDSILVHSNSSCHHATATTTANSAPTTNPSHPHPTNTNNTNNNNNNIQHHVRNIFAKPIQQLYTAAVDTTMMMMVPIPTTTTTVPSSTTVSPATTIPSNTTTTTSPPPTTTASPTTTSSPTTQTTTSATPYVPPPMYPKTDTETAFLLQALPHNFVFEQVSTTTLQQLVQSLEPYTVVQDTIIIQQGEPIGDYFYVIYQGTVAFVLQDTIVGTGTDGDSFGELSLLYSAPRAATVIATSSTVRLYRVNQITFRTILQQQSVSDLSYTISILRQVQFLQDFDDVRLYKLAAAMEGSMKTFTKGTVIVQKGDLDATICYILVHGTVCCSEISISSDACKYQDVILQTCGDYFGERAIMTGEPRAATVTAISDTPVLCMTIEQSIFETVLGDFHTVISKANDERKLVRRLLLLLLLLLVFFYFWSVWWLENDSSLPYSFSIFCIVISPPFQKTKRKPTTTYSSSIFCIVISPPFQTTKRKPTTTYSSSMFCIVISPPFQKQNENQPPLILSLYFVSSYLLRSKQQNENQPQM
jgi:cAMP-dependent protein kinase regulator